MKMYRIHTIIVSRKKLRDKVKAVKVKKCNDFLIDEDNNQFFTFKRKDNNNTVFLHTGGKYVLYPVKENAVRFVNEAILRRVRRLDKISELYKKQMELILSFKKES